MQKPSLLSCLLFFFIPQLSFSCPPDQRQSLLEFKNLLTLNINNQSTAEFTLGELKTWMPNSDCCKWQRVRCDPRSPWREVIELHLNGLVNYGSVSSSVLRPVLRISSLETLDVSYSSIQGEIPGEGFVNLTRIISLDMSSNSFNGSIPPGLFSLKTLQRLDLSWNAIGGTLSGDIKELKNLEELILKGNLIGGEIPPEIGNLTELRILSLKENKFYGSIPPLSVSQLAKLVTIDLEKNSMCFEIPTWLFGLQMLDNLRLGGNKLQWNKNGSVVAQFKLTYLSLRSCGLEGNIPDWLKNQRALRFLDLSKNRLQGRLPKSFAGIGTVILSDNKLSGSLPPSLFLQSHKSWVLALSRNNFSGQIPDTIGETSIMVLALSENNFSGSVPQSISNNIGLRLLDLSKNRFSGEFPRFNNRDSFLMFLDISSNEFSGDVPASFGLRMLMLSMSQNNFSGEFPQNFTELPFLKHLDLQDNKISGKFPSFIARLFPSLEVLSLRNNSLKGSIPEDVSNLTSLKTLDLSENNLDGPLPSSLGNLTGMIQSPTGSPATYLPISLGLEIHDYAQIHDLTVNWKNSKQGLANTYRYLYTLLDLSKNNFSGEIPTSLSNLKSLKLLNLSYNNISGLIPQSFGDLEKLESLDLSYNNLSGEIPQTFSKLSELNTLGLSHNRLSGKIPESPQLDRLNDPNIYASNNNICGMQIKVSCSTQSEQPEEDNEEDKEEAMFSWKAAVIGYPCGFLIAVLLKYAF